MRILRGAVVTVVATALLAGCSAAGSPNGARSTASAAEATPAAIAKVTVPVVVGKTRRDAYAALQTIGLAPIVTNNEVLNTAPYDQNPAVAAQEPSAGAIVDEGTVINLTLQANTPSPTPTPTLAPAPALPAETVVYAVTGSGVDGAGAISYIVPNGTFGQEQAVNVGLPWSKEIPITGTNLVYVLTAQGSGGGGSITCTITVRGRVVSTQTSTGAYAVVTCSS
jgi:hypothetical protein